MTARRGADRPSAPRHEDDHSETAPESSDKLLIHGFSEGGRAAHVIRARRDRLEAGVLRPIEDGKPIMGDLVQLKSRPEFPLLFDVEEKYTAPRASRKPKAGPPRVTNEAFLRGWEAIWGIESPSDDDPPN